MTATHELVLSNGERRTVTLSAHAGSIGNVLARLDDWIKTDDGGWVQKSFVVEVRSLEQGASAPGEGSVEEMRSLDEASGEFADEPGSQIPGRQTLDAAVPASYAQPTMETNGASTSASRRRAGGRP